MADGASELRPQPTTYAGLFVVTLTTLMYQVALTRILGVSIRYPGAFVVSSVALLGMAVGALVVHLRPQPFPDDAVRRQQWRFSLLFAVSVVAAVLLQSRLAFEPRASVVGMASVVATCAAVSVPFVLSGVVVCLSLTRYPGRVARLYAADLVGAGAGCVLVAAAFTRFDGSSVVIVVAALACAGALLFAVEAGLRSETLLSVALLVALAASAGLGLGPTIDPLRSAADGARSGVVRDDVRDDVTTIGYHALAEGCDAATVGRERDVFAALELGCDHVTGLDIDGDVRDLVGEPDGDVATQLDRDPRVDIVHDDARTWLTRTDRRFDQIHISLVGTSDADAGVLGLGVSGLFTIEAWDTLFDRLAPGGVLSVSLGHRHDTADEPLETFRVTALASRVLTDRGVDNPRNHVLAYQGRRDAHGAGVATILVSPEPFPAVTINRLNGMAEAMGLPIVLVPNRPPADDVLARLTAPGGPGPAVAASAADISPPTDDRPFFFEMATPATLLRGGVDDDVLRPLRTLVALFLAVLVLTALGIGGALTRATRRAGHRGMTPYYGLFAATGLGFALIAQSQVLRLTTFLGHPNHAVTVVPSTVLVFGGLGSLVAERLTDPDRPATWVCPVVALSALVVAVGLATPSVVDALAGETAPVRVAAAVGLVAPPALLMGMPVSIGLRAAGRRRGAPMALLLGVHAATAVVGWVLGAVVAVVFGITATLVCGLLAYGLAAGALAMIADRARQRLHLVGEAERLAVPGRVVTDDDEPEAVEPLEPAGDDVATVGG